MLTTNDCPAVPGDPLFSVVVENVKCGMAGLVSCTKAVKFNFNNVEIYMVRGSRPRGKPNARRGRYLIREIGLYYIAMTTIGKSRACEVSIRA